MPVPKRCVYILRSQADPTRYYTGVTSDLRARLADHNAGRCPHTAKARPWEVDVIVKFDAGKPDATAAGRRGSNMLWAQLMARSFDRVTNCTRHSGSG